MLVDAVTIVACASRVEWLEAVAAPEDAASRALLDQVGVALVISDGVAEGRGRLQLLGRARVNRRAVLTLVSDAAVEKGDKDVDASRVQLSTR